LNRQGTRGRPRGRGIYVANVYTLDSIYFPHERALRQFYLILHICVRCVYLRGLGEPQGALYTDPPVPSRAVLVIQADDCYMGLGALREIV